MLKNRILALSVALGVAGSALLAGGHALSPIDQAIKARQSLMELYSFNLGVLGEMAKGSVDYDADAASAAAANLAALSALNQMNMWPPGSDNAAAKNTRALPSIWANYDDTIAKEMALAAASATLAGVAGQGIEQLQSGMRAIGGACSACHKANRARAN